MKTNDLLQAYREEAEYTKNHSPKSQIILKLLDEIERYRQDLQEIKERAHKKK